MIKVGVELAVNRDLTVRGGYNHSDNPVQREDITFNIIAPGVVQNHLTAGLTVNAGRGVDLNVAYMHAFDNSVSGAAMMLPGGGVETVRMHENSLGVSITKRFK